MRVLAECTGHCTMWQSYTGLMTDVPHILFELSLEVITLVVGVVLGAFFQPVRRFRRRLHLEIDREHGVEHHDLPPVQDKTHRN